MNIWARVDGVCLVQLLLVCLPLVMLPVIVGLFHYIRGNKRLLIELMTIYIMVALIIPVGMYIYYGVNLNVVRYWGLTAQVLMFLSGLVVLIPTYQKCSYKTNHEFQATKPRVDNSHQGAIIYPHWACGFLMGWMIVIVTVTIMVSLIMWCLSEPSMWASCYNGYLQLGAVCVVLVLVFLLYLRLFPRCPYCQTGLFDMDLRYQAPTRAERRVYLKSTYKTLWNVISLQAFNCRYCHAPFIVKKPKQ